MRPHFPPAPPSVQPEYRAHWARRIGRRLRAITAAPRKPAVWWQGFPTPGTTLRIEFKAPRIGKLDAAAIKELTALRPSQLDATEIFGGIEFMPRGSSYTYDHPSGAAESTDIRDYLVTQGWETEPAWVSVTWACRSADGAAQFWVAALGLQRRRPFFYAEIAVPPVVHPVHQGLGVYTQPEERLRQQVYELKDAVFRRVEGAVGSFRIELDSPAQLRSRRERMAQLPSPLRKCLTWMANGIGQAVVGLAVGAAVGYIASGCQANPSGDGGNKAPGTPTVGSRAQGRP